MLGSNLSVSNNWRSNFITYNNKYDLDFIIQNPKSCHIKKFHRHASHWMMFKAYPYTLTSFLKFNSFLINIAKNFDYWFLPMNADLLYALYTSIYFRNFQSITLSFLLTLILHGNIWSSTFFLIDSGFLVVGPDIGIFVFFSFYLNSYNNYALHCINKFSPKQTRWLVLEQIH